MLPVSGDALYQPREPIARQLAYFALRDARRPAYTDATLARAIREGVDAAGRLLVDPMPRYDLDDEEMAQLIAYLKSLSSASIAGVTEKEIHFATIVTEGVAVEQRRAMLDVLEAFVRDKNAETRYETRRAERGPWTMTDYRAYRKWRLHVWELHGPEKSWPEQLSEYYRRQPVFAMLSGIASGPWWPIHRFCESHRLPCLFPTTDLPALGETDFYPLYFSKGVTLDAEVLVSYLQQEEGTGRLIQVVSDEAESVAGAQAFSEALKEEGREVQDVQWKRGGDSRLLWRDLLREKHDVTLILWLRKVDLAHLTPWSDALHRVVLFADLTAGEPQIPDELRGKVLAVYPFVLPQYRSQQLARLRSWLRLKNISSNNERILADAYFAVTVAADGLMRIATVFSREYFIERIEEMIDDTLTHSVYPRVSLGPGQRFVSKGAYMVELPSAEGANTPPRWIIPSQEAGSDGS